MDTNVFISAFVFGGKPLEVIKLILDEKIEVYISSFIINEIVRILQEKFNWEESRINQLLNIIETSTIKVFPRTKLALIKEKDDDNRILECALEGHVAYIVTGDKKHILALKEFNGIRIVSVDEFLKIFNRDVSFR